MLSVQEQVAPGYQALDPESQTWAVESMAMTDMAACNSLRGDASAHDWAPGKSLESHETAALRRSLRSRHSDPVVEFSSIDAYAESRRQSKRKSLIGGMLSHSWSLGEMNDGGDGDEKPSVNHFLDDDLHQLFGSSASFVPTISADYNPLSPACIISVHAIGVVLLIARFCILCYYRQAARSELFKCLGLTLAYVIVGIAMPRHADMIKDSAPVRRILVVRECYYAKICKSSHQDGIKQMPQCLRIMQPCSLALAFVVPIVSLAQVLVFETSEAGTFQENRLSPYIHVIGMTWFLTALAFGTAGVEFVCLHSSSYCVEGLAHELEHYHSDWNRIYQRCHKVHEVLSEIWHPQSAGGLWMTRVLLLLLSSLSVAATSLHHPDPNMRIAFRIFAVMQALAASILLLQIALVTRRCKDPRQGSKSILSIARSHGGRVTGVENILHYQCVMNYLQTSGPGVEIHGVPISLSLVITVGINMVGTLQIALLFVDRVLSPSS